MKFASPTHARECARPRYREFVALRRNARRHLDRARRNLDTQLVHAIVSEAEQIPASLDPIHAKSARGVGCHRPYPARRITFQYELHRRRGQRVPREAIHHDTGDYHLCRQRGGEHCGESETGNATSHGFHPPST